MIAPTSVLANAAIDGAILSQIKAATGVRSSTLAALLLGEFGAVLPRTDSKHYRPRPDSWNASELANRSCQRLRKRGVIALHKGQWVLVS